MLTELAPNLWEITSELRMPGGTLFPLRATLIRLPDGDLWLHSPVAFTDEDAAAIDTLGPVRHIVAPSALHHLYAGHAAARWPGATLHAARALGAKRPDLAVGAWLSGDSSWGDGAIRTIPVAGAPSADEHVFFHVPTRSLLVTDLLFNVQRGAWRLALTLTFTGAWKRLALSRVWWFLVQDRQAAARSAAAVVALQADNLIPCHGDPLLGGAAAPIEHALRWMLAPARVIASA